MLCYNVNSRQAKSILESTVHSVHQMYVEIQANDTILHLMNFKLVGIV